ncbi:DegT/DnrJ/EryC1/StrS family aminotransferase [Nitrospiraceae bacterium AH_259_D15_M11_P09]|nr:DegT/DnrJ/EryC1/StrS family aminotransferase [Nitrospiraceae bacterium AH_259_D15_M11_P09]
MTTLPIIRPTLPAVKEVEQLLAPSWKVGAVTLSETMKAFEAQVCHRTCVNHAVALSSCTAGLMLIPRALSLPAGSEVIVPSFTFAATAQALVWNGLVPVFCDCLPGTCTMDPEDVARNVTPATSAICGVTVYGLPPDIEGLLEVGRRNGLPVYFDSAQGLGATYKGRPLGSFGVCEVFSLSPTKVVTAIEGGLITTNDEQLAMKFRAMRDYGKDPSGGEEMVHMGLSARMSELHAAVGVLSLRRAEDLVKARLDLIEIYRERLGRLPGCSVQHQPADRTSSGNYFVLFISERAKLSRDEVHLRLKDAGIQTKRYFYPPVHEQKIFQNYPKRVSLAMREAPRISREALALPLYSHMTPDEQDRVCSELEKVLV